jgi:positive regulator of sigma E activity
LEGPIYFITVALFWMVLLATARMRHDLMLVFCIPPVFVAIVMGFSMGVYAWDSFGTVQALVCPVLAWFGARELARRYEARDFLIAIYLVWAVGLVFASIAIGFPDAA